MDRITKCPECGAPIERMHTNVLYDPKHYVYHRCTQCDWDDAPFDHHSGALQTRCGRTDDPDETVEPDDIEPDTGEEDDIQEYNQQLRDMYARGYREGRLTGYAEALTQKAQS